MSSAIVVEDRQQFALWRSWATWGCAVAFFFFQFVVRVSPSVFANELMVDLGLTAKDLGFMGGVYYWSYAMVQLFVGVTLDRMGVRYPLAAASLMVLAGCILMAVSDSLMVLTLARFITGVGSAFGFLSCIKTASTWFASERLGLMIGVSIMIGMAGATSGGYPMAYLVKHIGWRDSMMVLSLFAAVLVFLTLFLARDRKDPLGHSLVGEIENLSVGQSLLVLLRNSQTYLFAIYGALMYVPMSGFADMWGVKYMMTLYGVDSLVASGSASITYIGLAVSGPLLALVSDRFRSYKLVMMAGSLVTLVGYSLIIYFPPGDILMTYPMFFVIGFALGGQFFAFASICELNPLQVSATASGFQNMINMLAGAASISVIGMVLDYVSDGRLDDVISRYTVPDFHIALSIVPICVTLACVLLMFVREAYPSEEVKVL